MSPSRTFDRFATDLAAARVGLERASTQSDHPAVHVAKALIAELECQLDDLQLATLTTPTKEAA